MEKWNHWRRMTFHTCVYCPIEDVKYIEFISSATILNMEKGVNYGKLSILSLNGKEIKFSFSFVKTVDDNHMLKFQLHDDSGSLELYYLTEICYAKSEYIYELLGFPESFCFDSFVSQICYICTNQTYWL